jgi:hypothetical protein
MSTNAPEDDRAAAGVPGVPPAHRSLLAGIPLVLQVSPLDAESSQHDGFFYNAFANINSGNFAVACALFIHHGHVVVFHECPDAIAFQELYPLATIGYILALPPGLIAMGHDILRSQRKILCASQQTDPPPVTPP